MAYIPDISINTTPDGFEVVNAPNIFTFTASFSGTTGTINQSKVFCDLQILDQNIEAVTVIENVGRFKFPPRANNTYIVDFHDILKTYVTFPYDTLDKSPLRSAYLYVDESSGFGTTMSLGLFPFLAPEVEGIVRYNFNYGIEWVPNMTFDEIVDNSGNPQYIFGSINPFVSTGDTVIINVNSGLYTYYNGSATVLNVATAGSQTLITTDQTFSTTLDTLSGGFIDGSFTSVSHNVGTSDQYFSFNGTKQWFEKDILLGERYCLVANNSALTDYGYDRNHCLQIRPGQGERIRFLADFYGDSGYTTLVPITESLYIGITEYDNNLTPIGATTVGFDIRDQVTSFVYSQKCFTVCAFDTINTIPITDGHYYQVEIYKLFFNYPSPPAKTHLCSVWYRGQNQCSIFDNYRIKFLNRQGSWQYWNFNRDTKQTSTINRTEYKRPSQYDYTLENGGFGYSLSKLRGTSLLSSNVVETFTMNTDWISEDDYKFLNQLVTSPEVYIYYDDNLAYTRSANLGYSGYKLPGDSGHNIPIIITDTSYDFKTTNREQLFNLTITFKYAFDTNIQNQ